MIRYVKHSDIDFERWDYCIQSSLNSYIYGFSWYLNIVSECWDAIIEEDYSAVFPLPYRKKFGVKYIYQPAFAQQLGLFTTIAHKDTLLFDFLKAIPNEFSLVEFNQNRFYLPENQEYNIFSKVNIELDLSRNAAELEQNYSTNLKRNLKKARFSELKLQDNLSPKDLISLFRNNKGKDLNAYNSVEYENLSLLLNCLVKKSLTEIYGVFSNKNELVAAASFVFSGDKIIFFFSGLNQLGKELGAMPFLIDALIKKNANKSLIFDFEGSNDSDLARFYLSFGASKYEYKHVKINRLNKIMKLIFSVYKYLKR
jgi:hypothetical protein